MRLFRVKGLTRGPGWFSWWTEYFLLQDPSDYPFSSLEAVDLFSFKVIMEFRTLTTKLSQYPPPPKMKQVSFWSVIWWFFVCRWWFEEPIFKCLILEIWTTRKIWKRPIVYHVYKRLDLARDDGIKQRKGWRRDWGWCRWGTVSSLLGLTCRRWLSGWVVDP